jgi:hypothetical protein
MNSEMVKSEMVVLIRRKKTNAGVLVDEREKGGRKGKRKLMWREWDWDTDPWNQSKWSYGPTIVFGSDMGLGFYYKVPISYY